MKLAMSLNQDSLLVVDSQYIINFVQALGDSWLYTQKRSSYTLSYDVESTVCAKTTVIT